MINKEFRSPVYNIIAIPFEKIVPNTYNPNNVAPPEMRLLYDSIKEDGYTMPIVCYHVKSNDKYVIVDGFHRWRVMRDYKDIYEREKGMMPVSIIDKPLSDRMASVLFRHIGKSQQTIQSGNLTGINLNGWNKLCQSDHQFITGQICQ